MGKEKVGGNSGSVTIQFSSGAASWKSWFTAASFKERKNIVGAQKGQGYLDDNALIKMYP